MKTEMIYCLNPKTINFPKVNFLIAIRNLHQLEIKSLLGKG